MDHYWFTPVDQPRDGVIDIPVVTVRLSTPTADDFSPVYDLVNDDASFTDEETECS